MDIYLVKTGNTYEYVISDKEDVCNNCVYCYKQKGSPLICLKCGVYTEPFCVCSCFVKVKNEKKY